MQKKINQRILGILLAFLITLSSGIILPGKASAVSEQGLTTKPWSELGPALDAHMAVVSGYSYSQMMCASYVGDALNKVYGNTGFSSANTTVSELHRMFESRGVTVVAEGSSTSMPAAAQPGDIVLYYEGPYYQPNDGINGTVHAAIIGEGGMLYHSFESSAWGNDGPVGNLTSFYDWAVGNIQYNKNYDMWRIYRGITPPQNGHVQLKKSTAHSADLVALAPICYSLGGAEYTVYADEGLTSVVGTLTTNKNGETNILTDLEAGTYYAKETKAPNGFALDPNVYSVEVVPEETATFEVADKPMFDPIALLLKKEATDPNNQHPIEGAIFEVSYYDGIYSDVSNLSPVRTWKIKTNKDGVSRLHDNFLVGGDDLFRDPYDSPIGLIGTYTMREVEAPFGYAINPNTYYAWVRENGVDTEEGGTYFSAPTIPEDNFTGSIRLVKYEAGSDKEVVVPGATFMLYQVTDDSKVELGEYTTDDNGELKIDGLAIGKYELVELSAPEGYRISQEVKAVEIDGTEKEAKRVEFENKKIPELQTTLLDNLDNEKDLTANETIQVKDIVEYSGLIIGKEYTVKGEIIRKSDQAVLATSEVTFTAEQRDGNIDVLFDLDTSDLAGSSIVATEKLYREGEELASHFDLEDENQTIEIPKIGTKASLDEENTSVEEETITIIDQVSYTNLIVGKEYTVKGILMDKETGKTLLVDGKEVTSEATFTADNKDGSVDMVFTFDNSGLAGKDIVVFEDLYRENKKVAVHADIEDEGQTVEIPKIGTKATIDGEKAAVANKDMTIVDQVSYTNLTVGQEYTVKGVLMDKETGKTLLVDGKTVYAEKTFTPTEKDGTIEVTFTFDGTTLAGKKVVVFEQCYQDGKLIAVHADINDEGQTVKIEKEPPTPKEEPKKKNVDGSPKTGDSGILVPMTLLSVSILGLAGLYVANKRKNLTQ